MPPRRIWIAVLCGVALVGFLGGGLVAVFGGDGGGTKPAAAPVTTPVPSGPAKPSSVPAADVATSAPPTSAPPSASASASASATPKASASKPPPPSPAAGQGYMLTLPDGRAMDVMGASDRDRVPVIAYPKKAGKPNQQWVVRDAGGGFVRLESVLSHKCLQATDGRGARAEQDDCGRGDRQLWKPQAQGTGFVLVAQSGGALGFGDRIRGEQGLTLVPAGAGLVWQLNPA